MKTVIRTSLLLVATLASQAASTTFAAGPAPGVRPGYTRYAANPKATSRVSNRTGQVTPPAAEPEHISAPPADEGSFYEGGDPGMWDDTGSEACCDDGGCDTCKRGLWYFSMDYLLMRPRLSQGVAAETRKRVTEQNGSTPSDTVSTLYEESVNYCFNYNSSFRVALGYRLLDCGSDIQFAYWRLTGNAAVSLGPASIEDEQLIIAGQVKNNPEEGQFYSANTGITANIYDLDFARCLALGGPQAPCDCNFCPRWDLRWAAGLRAADISRYNNNVVTEENGDAVSWGNIDATFVGAGPRIGLQGRRYFGQCGMLSVFAKGSQALLIGNYKMSRVLTDSGDEELGRDITNQYDQFCRMIPVTDIEVGGTWQVAPYAFVSVGWFFQCWWDLGQAEDITTSSFGPLDSANILSFDGLFVRGELLF